MIIEILKPKDVDKVDDTVLSGYLEYSLHRLPNGFDYFDHVCEYGYFCIVTEIEDLIGEGIALHDMTLPSMKREEFWERIELIEERDDVIEILVQVDTDVMISLIMRLGILDEGLMERIYVYIDM